MYMKVCQMYSSVMTRRGPRSPIPLYQQIVNAIRADIESGTLKPGHALPKEDELGATHEASRLTVRRALKILRDEGLIYTVHPEGSYVGPPDVPRIRRPWPFEKVANDIVMHIRDGDYKPNEVLPSETEMIANYKVAKSTVRSALDKLRKEGWVYTVPAIGTFVSEKDKWPETE